MKKVYWTCPLGPSQDHTTTAMLMRIAKATPHALIHTGYARTDMQRQQICDTFMKVSRDPLDTLVMIDQDHRHPEWIVSGLTATDAYPVLGALAMMRKEDMPIPLAFWILKDGRLQALADWEPGGVIQVDFVAPCAIAIQRQVFLRLEAKGKRPPWWRYMYDDYPVSWPAEDTYFALICQEAGIPHYVHTGIEIPHRIDGALDSSDWQRYKDAHPGGLVLGAT